MDYLAAIQINANNVRIEGLTIEAHGGEISGGGDHIQIVHINATTSVSIEGSYATVSENLIKGDLSVVGNGNVASDNYFEINVVLPSVGCIGSNNIIANNRLATEDEESNIKLSLEGSNNIVAYNQLRGIEIEGTDNLIYKNIIKAVPGDSGVYLSHSSKNTVCANTITYAESITYQQYGVFLSESHDNLVYANHIEGVFVGAYLQNTDTEPMVTHNNTFYHNNFVDNQIQAWDTTSSTTNSFDNGKEGNYWSNYTGTDANGDGIGDTSYKPTAIYTYGQIQKPTQCSPDRYPLMKPFDINSVNLDLPEEANTHLTPQPTPNVPELSLPITLLLVSTLSIALLLIRRKTAN